MSIELQKNDQGSNHVPVGAVFQNMPVTRMHWKAGIALFISFVVQMWESMIIILIGDSIGASLKLTQVQIGSLIGSSPLGMILGCLLWGKLVDKFGRKRTTIWSLLSYALISLLSSFSVNFEILWWMRFLSGVALSGLLVVTFPYFTELLPVKVRGKAAVYLASGMPIGYLFAIGVTHLFGDLGWRWILGISSLGGLWFLAILSIPESPYWLVGKGRQKEAKEVIRKLSGGKIDSELDDVQLVITDVKEGSFLELFKRKYVKMTVWMTIFSFCFSWGYWALLSWLPLLLEKKGLSTPQGLGFLAITALFMFPGYMASASLTGRFGRKKVVFWFVLLAAIGGFGFATSNSVVEMYIWNFVYYFFSLGAWGVWNTWSGEMYPTDVRGVSVAWGLTAQNIASAVAPGIIGAMLTANLSFVAIVSFISLFLVVTCISSLFLRETENVILE
ncbi:MFS transporter [Brevibacillus nitrificans]|uniref:MFS transporter n=1 Tax=Brevibacillus nitrificans TaxID=651560 RepID=A0A3M8D4S6_9BACL|nr:MFS transporter [Brevibacillus nitrificans]RNB83042.1 MFS transporter [Brevibacillus nitrificans]